MNNESIAFINSISLKPKVRKQIGGILAMGYSGRILGARLREVDEKLFTSIYSIGSVGESYYRLVHGNPPGCKGCGAPTKFKTVTAGYNDFCSRKCAASKKRGNRLPKEYAHPIELNKVRTNRKLRELVSGPAPYMRGRIRKLAPNSNTYIEDVSKKLEVPFAQVLYHVTTGKNLPSCPVCGKCTRFYSASKGYKIYCSSKCSGQCPKVRAMSLEKFHARDKDKQKRKALAKYGVSHHTRAKSVKRKKVETCIKKYGAPHQLQNEEVAKRVFEKAINHEKVVIDGRVFWLSGYEKHALNRILSRVDGSNVITIGSDEYRTFRYEGVAGVRVYYPDFIVGKTVVEVKSTYTCTKNKKTWQNIRDKAVGVRSAGFKFLIWVFNLQGELICRPSTDLSFKELKKSLQKSPSRF